MVKTILLTATIVFVLGAANVSAQSKQVRANTSKTDLKFLEDISVQAAIIPVVVESASSKSYAAKSDVSPVAKNDATPALQKTVEKNSGTAIETANALQFKYSLLLDIEVELVKNFSLFKIIDEWYGTRYRLGGISKSGIDCSALMQVFFTALYGISLPRTAREQYNFSRKISRTEIREGDLVFFNTSGGVSHVGMYLANNKFVHSSSSGGVMISDLYESYYASRFIGVGRVDDANNSPVLITPKP